MKPLSKSIQLGVIILALRLLGELNFSLPRIIRRVAQRLGVSRKSGYQAASRVEELLLSPPGGSGDRALRRELLQLRIRTQVLTYERDHPGVRFADRHGHLLPEAKSLSVRLLREFRGELPESEIAGLIGVALSSLKRWDAEATPECLFPPRPDGRGQHRQSTAEDVKRVLDARRSLERSMTLEEFTEHFNSRHPDSALDRKTITRILQAHRERKIETRDEQKPYHSPFEVYFPGAQIAVDGTETAVVFSSQPEDPVEVKKEVAIDIATSTILGDAIGKEETAEGVERVLVQAQKECETVLAVLSDNGSANRSEKIQALTQEQTAVGSIFSFPRHPQTNGHLEGLFGQFSRIAGRIEIDDHSRESIATSVVMIIWRIFIYFHNYSPRERLGGLSPLEYLRRYAATPPEVEAAREGLEKRRQRSEALRRPHPRLSRAEFRELVEGTLLRHRLEVGLEEALGALLRYDEQVIRNASNAFLVSSQRDGFDERKRTFAYFMGIVRNKQKEIDAERIRRRLEVENTEKLRAQQREEERQRERQKAQEIEDLRHRPERVVLEYARKLLVCRLRYMRKTFGEGLRGGLQALLKLGRGSRGQLEELAGAIRGWPEFAEALKEQMVALLFATFEEIARRRDPRGGTTLGWTE